MAVFPPRWAYRPRRGAKKTLGILRKSIIQTASGWSSKGEFIPQSRPRGRVPKEGELAGDRYLPEGWSKPGVNLHRLQGHRGEAAPWSFEPLDRTWARFFPGVPEAERQTYNYPLPLSDRFWNEYAEPVGDFLSAAKLLRDAILGVQRWGPVSDINSDTDTDHRHQSMVNAAYGGRDDFASLLEGATPSIELHRDGSIRQLWGSASLISMFAVMALLDFNEQRRVVSCGNCGKLFVTGARKAAYCSPKCRWAEDKRRQRADKKKREGG